MTEERDKISFRMNLFNKLVEEDYESGTPEFDAEFNRRLVAAGFEPTSKITEEQWEAGRKRVRDRREIEQPHSRLKGSNRAMTIVLLIAIGVIVLMASGIIAT